MSKFLSRLLLLARSFILMLMPLLQGNIVFAQQDAMFTQYMFNPLAINPAYAGSRNVISLTALHRNQWVGLKGAPQTTAISADIPTWNNKLGLGLLAFNDEVGVTKSTGFYGIYTYRVRFSNEGTLALGLQFGATNYKAALSNVALRDAGDMVYSENINSLLPSFGAGIYYNTDKYYVGLSAPNLVRSFLRRDKFQYYSDVVARKFAHMFLMAGCVFDVNMDIKLKPSFLVKYVKGAPVQADVNAQLWLKDVVSVGGSVRSDKSGAMLLEVQCNPQIRIGYSYDISNKALASYNRGSHEIMLRYEFGFAKDKNISTRYF